MNSTAKQKNRPRKAGAPAGAPPEAVRRAIAARLVSRRILLLSNVLRRAAALRYRRLLGLSAGEWGVVSELGFQAPRTLNDLARAMGLDKTQLSRTVSDLVARGLVSRQPSPTSNREVMISLTAAGHERYAVLVEAGAAANERLLAGMTTRERDMLLAQIEVLMERARALLRAEQEGGTGAETEVPAKPRRGPAAKMLRGRGGSRMEGDNA